MNTKTKVLATGLVATSLFTSIQMQLFANDNLNIENHADFKIWIEEQKEAITSTKTLTLDELTKEEDISEVNQRYDYLIGYIDNMIIPAEASVPEDENYKINVQDFITDTELKVSEFMELCTQLIDSNKDVTEEINALKQQLNEQLNAISFVCTTKTMKEKYDEIFPIYKNRITSISTLAECEEMKSILESLQIDFIVKDGQIQDIENQTSDDSFQNYSPEKQEEIRTLVKTYSKKIADIETFDMVELSGKIAEIHNEFSSMKEQIPTIEQEFIQEKNKYTELLNNYSIDTNLYNYEKVVEIQELIDNAIQQINETSSIDQVKGIYDKCLQDISKVPTKAQETESLNAYKTEKLNDFKKGVSKSLYFVEEQSQIDDIINSLTTEINNASTTSLVDVAIDEATLNLAELKTKVAYKSEAVSSISESSNCQLEENIALIKEKYDKIVTNIQEADTKQKLDNYVTQFNTDKTQIESAENTYIEAKISEIQNVSLTELNHYLQEAQDTRTEAINDVNNATSKVQIEAIVADYKSMINNYKSDENTYQQLVLAKETALNELNALNEECDEFLPQFKERAKSQISDAILKINSATQTSRVQQLLEVTKINISYIRDENNNEVLRLEQLETDKNNAKQEVNDLRDIADTFLLDFKNQAIQKIDKAIIDIDNCTTSNEVASIVETLKIEFNSINLENINEVKRLEQLELAKTDAIKAINDIDLSSLTETNLEEANEIVENTIDLINEATTSSEVSSIKNQAISRLNAILDSNKEEEELLRELEEAKTSAIHELEALDYSTFTDAHQTILEELINEAKEEINSVTLKSEILPIVDRVKDEFNSMKLEEANLTSLKISAKNELSLISTNGLLQKNVERIQVIKTTYSATIDNCTTIDEINQSLEMAKTEINRIKQEDYEEQNSNTEEKALATAKQNAINLLNEVSIDGLLEKNKTQITTLISETKEDINNATSVNLVSTILNNCINEIDKIKREDTEEQNSSRELIASKNNALETLDNIELDGLLEKNKTEIVTLIIESKAKINSAKTVEEVRNELKKTINQINNIKALDVIEQEDISMLAQAKIDTIKILNNISIDELLEKNQILVSDLIAETIENVNKATSVNEVNELLSNATTEIDAIKVDDTKEQSDINSLAKTKQLAIQVLNSIVLDNFKDSYKNEALEVINQAKKDIQVTNRRETVTNILSNAVISVNEIKERNRIEIELDNYKLNLISELNIQLLQKTYFSDEQIEGFNNLKESIIQNINNSSTKEQALNAQEKGIENYNNFIESSFIEYKTSIKDEVNNLYTSVIKISSNKGDEKLEDILTRISNATEDEKPQELKTEFVNWLDEYKTEVIINDISYKEPIVEGSTNLDKSKFTFDIKDRSGKVINVSVDDIEIINFEVISENKGKAEIRINNLGNHFVDIDIRKFTLEEIKTSLVANIQEIYNETIKNKTEETEQLINNFIQEINNSNDKEEANQNHELAINFINEQASKVYQETLNYSGTISIDDIEINKENLIYNITLYNGQVVTPEYTISNILWNENTPYIELVTKDGVQKQLELKLEDNVNIDTLINEALAKLEEYESYSFSDLSKQLVDKINETKVEINNLTTIAQYKEKYNNLIQELDELNQTLKNINSLRNEYLEKISLLDISNLKDEYKEILENQIESTTLEISSLNEKEEMEEIYEELYNNIEHYKQLQRDELDLKEFKDTYITQINKIDSSIYEKEDEVKELIETARLSISNAKDKLEVENIWNKFETELKEFKLVPEPTTPEETTESESSEEESSEKPSESPSTSEKPSESESESSSKEEESSETESTEESSEKPSESSSTPEETTKKEPESSSKEESSETTTGVVKESSIKSQLVEKRVEAKKDSTETSEQKVDGVSEKVKTEDSSTPYLLAFFASLGISLSYLFKKRK